MARLVTFLICAAILAYIAFTLLSKAASIVPKLP